MSCFSFFVERSWPDLLLLWPDFSVTFEPRFPQELDVGKVSAEVMWTLFAQDMKYALEGKSVVVCVCVFVYSLLSV